MIAEQFDACEARNRALQQRLTAADERNDEAIDLLRRARAVIAGGGWADLERDIAKFLNNKSDLKPAETVAGHHPACRAVDDYKPGECSHSCKPATQPQGEPVAPWFYFVECEDPDYSGLFNHESEAQTQASDHGGSVVKLWNVPPTWRPEPQAPASFWQWLDSAYRDGSKGDEARFTKYNMEVAYSAGMSAEQPAPVAVVPEQTYRLLGDGDVIMDGDETLNDDTATWGKVPMGVFIGMPYNRRVMLPVRRAKP